MQQVMNQIMEGEATGAQIGSFITALRMKGETIDEISGRRAGHAAKGDFCRYRRRYRLRASC